MFLLLVSSQTCSCILHLFPTSGARMHEAGNVGFPVFKLQLPTINEHSISINSDCNTWGTGWSKLGGKVVKWKKKKNSFQLLPFLHTDAEEFLQRQHSTFPFFPSQTHSHMHTHSPVNPPHGFPSASEMWVNEAPPGGTVSNTYTTTLIRGRGGKRVGGSLWDTEHGQHQRWKCGRVRLIRQNDCGMHMNYKSRGR